jgi:uncharacterized membrane protein
MSFRLLSALLFFPLLAAVGSAAEPAAPNAEALRLASEVHAIFEAKCVDCHGPELPRPKGKFGYVLDLKRLAANRKYIVPGKPEDSELYDLVFHDDMPGEDANVPPLTMEEKEKVRRWIEIGAPGDLPAAAEKEATLAPAPPPPPTAREPLWKGTLRWIGKLHPASTHFPVALMLVAVLAEGIAWWTRLESWKQTVRFLVVLGALSGLAASGLGWMNAYFSSYNHAAGALLWWHRWIGTGTALWSVICAVLICLGPCVEGSKERQRFRGALLLGATLVGISGFLGSALIYGLQHYAWN